MIRLEIKYAHGLICTWSFSRLLTLQEIKSFLSRYGEVYKCRLVK